MNKWHIYVNNAHHTTKRGRNFFLVPHKVIFPESRNDVVVFVNAGSLITVSV